MTAVLALTVASVSAQSTETKALKLDDALAASMSNYPLVRQAQAAVDAARAKEAQATSAYLPRIDGSAAYADLGPQEGMDLDLSKLNPRFPDERFAMSPSNAWDFHLEAEELVFDFGRREVQVRLARSGIDAATIGLDQIKTSIAYKTADIFYSMLFLKREIKVLAEQMSTLEQHLADAQAREKTGTSTHYDVLTTQVRIAGLESERIDARGQLVKQEAALAELTGLPGDLEPEGDLTPRRIDVDSVGIVREASARRDEIKLALAGEERSELAAALAKLGNKPKIAFSAQIGYRNGILTYDNSDVDKLLFDWKVGLMVDVPIFDGLLTARKSEEAEALLRSDREKTEALRERTKTAVLQALEDMRSSHEQVQNSLIEVSRAQEALDMAKIQYGIGVFTNLQYLDSQTSLELAKMGELRAAYHELLCQLAFKEAIGERL
jgi:outer membrane protein